VMKNVTENICELRSLIIDANIIHITNSYSILYENAACFLRHTICNIQRSVLLVLIEYAVYD